MSISQELKDWAKLAGYSLSVDSSDGPADMFWNQGGEIRYFIKEAQDGWINVTCSDRLQPEYFYFAGRTIEVVERFFFGWFGNTMRSNRGMPLLDTPISPEQLATGYQLATRQIDGVDRYVLINPDGTVVAVSSGGEISAASDLVPLSTYLSVPPAEIMRSFTNEGGEPLFSVLD
ncbi:Imm61 family immunity protein [Mycobacterium sp. ST-F2]|uniref:Imm61 family immunity protein n=1 Tax=Mycobacterium sp. ST-F2 TaxID=1490484 RepID=UPI001151840B|nr:Imm61 family immunity protein [Mycobacterium sp. ST-F2]